MKRLSPIISVLFCLLYISQARAQNPVDSINAQLRSIYGGITTNPNPRWFLFDMAAHELDSPIYVAMYNRHDSINTDTWFKLYEEMRNAAFDTTVLPRHDSLYIHSLDHGADTVNMMVMEYNYVSFNDDALATDKWYLFDSVNNTISDKPNPLYWSWLYGSPFEFNKVFAAAPNKLTAAQTHLTFRIDPQHIMLDPGSILAAPGTANYNMIRIDFGDGSGWHVYPDVTQLYHTAITYPGAGTYTIKVMMSIDQNWIYSSLSNLIVTAGSDAPAPDETILTPGIRAAVYLPCDASGGPYEKTIIYVEGIDLKDFLPGLNRNAAQIYDEMLDGPAGIAKLRNLGYTIVVVDWINSRQDIRINSAFLYDLIAQLQCRACKEGQDCDDQFVVIGESMGGLVARHALMFMESHPTACAPQSGHSTRLLMTWDSPHRGANIPLSLQHLYRSTASLLMGSTITQQITGLANNMLLDSKAAKQMLLYHVDTHVPFGPYMPHAEKLAFDAELHAMGDYPKFCKLFAMSNGSLKGRNQTRDFDGKERSDNDYLLKYSMDKFIEIRITRRKRLRLQISGTRVELRTNPNGYGMTAGFDHGIYVHKIKVRRWRFQIDNNYVPVVGMAYFGHALPICVKPGGIEDFGSGIPHGLAKFTDGFGKAFFPNFDLVDNNDGHYQISASTNGFLALGHASDIYSDGFHWNFIPTWSSLDYANNGDLAPNIEDEAIGTKVSNTPFDVITGIYEKYPNNYSYGSKDYNTFMYNRRHLHLRNDPLKDGNGNKEYYKDCDKQQVYMLQREIGDDKLYIENRVLPWRALYDAAKEIHVDERSPYYEYPTPTGSGAIRPGVYSKENILDITGPFGFARFATMGANVTYPAPPNSSWTKEDIKWVQCCDGHKSPLAAHAQPPLSGASTLTVYPNPVAGKHFDISFTGRSAAAYTVKITDLLGRPVYMNGFNADHNGTNSRSILLEEKPLPGVYILTLTDDQGRTQSRRITIL